MKNAVALLAAAALGFAAAAGAQEGTLDKAWDASEGDETFAVEFGLEREFMLPLATGKLDPFIGIVGALAELEPGELGLFQVLWQATEKPWAHGIMNAVSTAHGRPFFPHAPELTAAAEEKVAPLARRDRAAARVAARGGAPGGESSQFDLAG